MKRDRSESLYREAVQHLPGGVDSPVRAFRSVGGIPLFMKRGRGSRITDEDGNEFIDYCMSWGPLILGHADYDVVTAIRETALDGTSFGTPHRYELDLAKIVQKAFPSIERIRFVNSGTEATMSAIRLARGFTGRDKIVKFDGCYHGHADFLLVAAGSGLATFGTPDSAGVTSANAQDTLVIPYNDIKSLETLLAKEGESIAAIILEPVPCNYGLILPREGYLKKLRELCDNYGIVLIFDEVINGFRLAQGGAQEYYGVRADLTTLGKIIGGGLPVGAYGGRSDIMAKIAPEGPVYQAGTLSGNPLAMAAGIATLSKLDDGKAYRILRDKGEYLDRLMEPVLAEYQGRFMYCRLESIFSLNFTSRERIESVADIRQNDMKLFASFHREMLDRGVYLAPSGYEVGFISLAHTEEDLEQTASALTESLARVLKA